MQDDRTLQRNSHGILFDDIWLHIFFDVLGQPTKGLRTFSAISARSEADAWADLSTFRHPAARCKSHAYHEWSASKRSGWLMKLFISAVDRLWSLAERSEQPPLAKVIVVVVSVITLALFQRVRAAAAYRKQRAGLSHWTQSYPACTGSVTHALHFVDWKRIPVCLCLTGRLGFMFCLLLFHPLHPTQMKSRRLQNARSSFYQETGENSCFSRISSFGAGSSFNWVPS